MLAQLPEGWRADVPGSPCPYTPSWCASLLTRSLLAQDAAVAGLLSERGETVTITRAHHAVAEVVPARRRTGADLRAALERIPPPDDRFATDIEAALAVISSDGEDPWVDA